MVSPGWAASIAAWIDCPGCTAITAAWAEGLVTGQKAPARPTARTTAVAPKRADRRMRLLLQTSQLQCSVRGAGMVLRTLPLCDGQGKGHDGAGACRAAERVHGRCGLLHGHPAFLLGADKGAGRTTLRLR